jgi:hypothetical protein
MRSVQRLLRVLVCRRPLIALVCVLTASCGGDDDFHFTPFWSEAGVVVADFNGDGLLDVAVAREYVDGPPPHPGYVAVYLQTAPGKFAPPVLYPIGPDPWAIAAGDLFGTGKTDLVVVIPKQGGPSSGAISILRHDPANPGAFLPSQTVATGAGGDAVAIGDVTGDGVADLAVADGIIANAHAIVLAQNSAGSGSFLAPVSLPLGANRGSNDIAIHDMDGDGRNDIVLATSDGAAILYQNSSGGFGAPVLLPAGINPQGVAVADLDGDGRPDIIVANAGYAPLGGVGGASVSILRQTVLGSFTASSISVPDGAVSVIVADLNHDRVPDVAALSVSYVAPNVPSQVSILLQSTAPRGSFALSGTYTATSGANFISAGDINGDGYTDLVVSNPVSVMLQQTAAPGTFGAPAAL